MDIKSYVVDAIFVRCLFFILVIVFSLLPIDAGGVVLEVPRIGVDWRVFGYLININEAIFVTIIVSTGLVWTITGVLLEIVAVLNGVDANKKDFEKSKNAGIIYAFVFLVVLFGFGKNHFFNSIPHIFILLFLLSIMASTMSMLVYRILVFGPSAINLGRSQYSYSNKRVYSILILTVLLFAPLALWISDGVIGSVVSNVPMYTFGGFFAENLEEVTWTSVMLVGLFVLIPLLILMIASGRDVYKFFSLFIGIPLFSSTFVFAWILMRAYILPFVVDPIVLIFLIAESIYLSARYGPAFLEMATISFGDLFPFLGGLQQGQQQTP